MKKKKHPMRKMLDLGLGMAAGSAALSSLPANDIAPQVVTGMGKMAGFFPAYGSMAGAGMSIGMAGKVVRSAGKLSRRKKRR